MKPLLKAIDATSDWVGKVICFLIVGGMLILVYETMMRYGFSAPTTWAHEMTRSLIGPYFILGGVYALRHGAHVNMDIIYNRFSLRKRAILDVFTATLFFVFCGVLLWQGMGFAQDSIMILETSGTPLFLPIFPVKLMLPIAAFLIVLQGAAKFIRDLDTAVAGRKCEY